MSKFERVLSDDWLPMQFKSSNEVPVLQRMINRETVKDIVKQVEKAVVARLVAEQEPVWWVGLDTATGREYPTSCKSDAGDMASIERFVVTPLYAHPIPCVSPTSDKTACVSEIAESETQESAPFTPKTVSEMRSFIGMNFDSLQYANPETEEPDEMDRYTLTIHDLLSAFDWAGHYDCDRIADMRKKVPEGWKLVPIEITAEMLRDAHIRSELGAYAVSNLSEGYSLIRNLYDVLVASAPKYTGGNT